MKIGAMNADSTRKYRAQEFAKLAGVTVRTLHHYDRLGLLRPRRTQNRYRAYGERDLERLVQIVALKYVGLPLKHIRALLEQDTVAISDALGRQRRVLEAKRGFAIAGIGHAMGDDRRFECHDRALCLECFRHLAADLEVGRHRAFVGDRLSESKRARLISEETEPISATASAAAA